MIYRITQDKMRKMAIEQIHKQESMVIELGCSNGNFAKLIKEKGIENYKGIDIQSVKIKEARKKFPDMNFIDCDITKNLNLLKNATMVVSFESLEHMQDDLLVIKEIPWGCKVIISVPNSPYKGHLRYYEVDGWKDRYSPYLTYTNISTIQNPIKENKRAFLFFGVRNDNYEKV